MIVYFDTVRRKRPVREGGELVKLDWQSKKVLATVPLFPTEPDIEDDPNPRGNSRGGKGILIKGDEVFVGTYHTILVFDRDLNFKRRIANHLFANIHEMCFSGENTWVSATTIDCALLVDGRGNTLKTWWPREEPLLQERYRLSPMEIDKKADNRVCHLNRELGLEESHTHLNGVAHHAGHTYVLLNRQGALVQIEPEVKVVVEDARLRAGHSPTLTADGQQVVVCSSFQKEVLVYDLKKGNLVKQVHLLDFPAVAGLYRDYPDQPFNKSIFVRGLEIIAGGRILVGISPASILEIDTGKRRLLDIYRHSRDVGDAVHGLAHIPEEKPAGRLRRFFSKSR